MNELCEFKIWDYTNKKMVMSKNIRFYSRPKYGEEYRMVRGKASKISPFFSLETIKESKRFRILQFIGMIDKEGRKIFNYDLIENIGGLKGVVFYDKSKCKYRVLWENNCYSDMVDNVICKKSILENKKWLLKFRWIGLKGV